MQKITIEEISPAVAEKFLASNTRNRAVSEGHVRRLAKFMSSGEWHENGDTITFDTNGVLGDGQHRLHAIIKSGVTIKSIVVRGVTEESFITKDTGNKRRASDFVSINGYKNARNVAAVAALVYLWQKTGNPFHGTPEAYPSPENIVSLVDNDKQIYESACYPMGLSLLKSLCPPSILGFCHYAFSIDDKAACKTFFDALVHGEKIYDGSPVMLLRDALVTNMASKKRMDKRYIAALFFKAYKTFKLSASLKTLRVRTEGDAPEKDLYKL